MSGPARTAVIAGAGQLPLAVAAALEAPVFVTFAGSGAAPCPPHAQPLAARFERLGALFEALHAAGVSRVVPAGAMQRPVLDPARLDAVTADFLPQFQAAMAAGDDALLRAVVALFEGAGFTVAGPAEIAPDLLAAPADAIGPAPDAAQMADIARAEAVLAALSPLDVGQAAVAEAGLVLGIETLQGTDALLDFVAATPAGLRRGRGVLVKRAKAGQDLRVDMPTIGPRSLEGAARAGLAGVAVRAGEVLLLDRAQLAHVAARHDLFLAVL